RAKSGILRGREFLMNDLYSFHETAEDLDKYYWEVGEAYKRIAKRLGLKGFARNTVDRRVEAVFEGEKENLDEIIKICKKGAFLSEVENVEVKWESSQKDTPSSFEITR
ncbi:MAG: acylphosphatase, partial [Patescibacteria group bacterium]